jgi:HK97 family phage major capsid protein/HK97 family phage prohead protease
MTEHLQLERETKAVDRLDLEVKFDPGDAGTFTGRASIFGEPPDNYGDVVAHGAFRRSLEEHRARGTTPLMLWQHRADEPIGTWTSLHETSSALEVEGRLVLDTQRGAEAYALMKAAALNGLSIGFITRKSEARKGGGRTLKDMSLVEISLVSLPAASGARVISVKSRREAVHPPKDLSMTDAYEDAAETAAPEIEARLEQITAEIKAATDTAIADLAAKIDRVETRLNRPGAARIEVRDDPQVETKAFTSWCRKGWDGLGDIEKKVLAAGTGGSPSTDGWQLVPEVFLAELQKNLVEISPMRQVARVQTVSGTPVLLPRRTANLSSGWVAETAQHALSEPTYAQQSIPIFEARVSVEVTNQLLEDAAFNLASELSADFAEEFGRLEGEAFVKGNGTSEPEGFLTSSDFTTSAGAAALDADDVIGLYYAVPGRYAAAGSWLMRRETIASGRKLRSATDGPYIWADSIVPGTPASLMGRPVIEMPDMPISGSPAEIVIAFGDWNRAYRIFDRVGLEILRDPYTLARNSIVTFHARKRVGGALIDGAAVKGLSQ